MKEITSIISRYKYLSKYQERSHKNWPKSQNLGEKLLYSLFFVSNFVSCTGFLPFGRRKFCKEDI